MRDALWVGKRRRHEKTEWKRDTDNRKPEVRTAAILVLVREGLELEYCSGTGQFIYLFIIFYTPWIIWGKPHLDIGIVNISRNTLYNMC